MRLSRATSPARFAGRGDFLGRSMMAARQNSRPSCGPRTFAAIAFVLGVEQYVIENVGSGIIARSYIIIALCARCPGLGNRAR